MPNGEHLRTDGELKVRREAIRSGLARSATAGLIIVCAAVALALLAIFTAFRSERRAQESREVSEALWRAGSDQSRSLRLGRGLGAREQALATIGAASRVKSSLKLRDEAIAALAMDDFRETDTGHSRSDISSICDFDAKLCRLAVGGTDGFVDIVRVSDNETVARFGESGPAIRAVCFSPDDAFLAARTDDWLRIWRLRDAEEVYSVPLHNSDFYQYPPIAFSPDSRLLGYGLKRPNGEASRLVLVDVEAGGLKTTLPVLTGGFAFSADGRRIVTTTGERMSIWEIETAKRIGGIESMRVGNISAIAWSPDGETIALGGQEPKLLLFQWRSRTSKVYGGHARKVTHLAFNATGDRLISSDPTGETRVWIPWGSEALVVTDVGQGIRFNRDGTKIGFVRLNEGYGLWKADPSRVFRTFATLWPGRYAVENGCVDISADGEWLLVGKRFALVVFNLRSARRTNLPEQRGQSSDVRFHPKEKLIYRADRDTVTRWPYFVVMDESREGSLRVGAEEVLGRHRRAEYSEAGYTADFQSVMVVDRDRTQVEMLSLKGDSNATLFAGPSPISSAALSPDKHWVALGSGSSDQPTRILDLRDGRNVRELNPLTDALRFSPDGTFLVTSEPSEYVLWDCATWQPRHRFPQLLARDTTIPVDWGYGHIRFADDGGTLFLTPTPHSVGVCSTATGNRMATLSPPVRGLVGRLAWNEERQLLAVGYRRWLAGVWDFKALRRELKAMDLDWSVSGAEQTGSASEDEDRGFPLPAMIGTATGSALLVTLLSLYALARHRRLESDYLEIDAEITHRNEQLATAQTAAMHGQKMKALGTLAAGVAHDFNNLLSVIRMANKLIWRQTGSDPDVRQNIDDIEQAVVQGRAIVRSMLGYSREQEDAGGTYSVVEVVEDHVALLGRHFLEGITLNLDLDRAVPDVLGSRNRLEQILLNLIVNATDAMSGSGQLTARVTVTDDTVPANILEPAKAERYVALVLADTGSGIDADTLGRIFDPFFSTKDQGSEHGTGLGLSTVYTIAGNEGFGVGVETELGKGTAFVILIPVTEKRAPGAVLQDVAE